MQFKRQTEEYIKIKLGDEDSRRFRFNDLEQTLQRIASITELSADRMSVRSAPLVSIYLSERDKVK